MRYIMVAIWSLLISSAVSYVLTSMVGESFNFTLALGLAGIFAVAIIVLGDGILKGTEDSN